MQIMSKFHPPGSSAHHILRQQASMSTINCIVLIVVVIVIGLVQSISAQCPMNTMTTFERVGGVTLKDTPMTLLYSVSNSSVGSMMGLNRLPGVPITAECNNRCRKSARCRAFLVDYARQLCYSIDQPPSSLQQHSGLHLGHSAGASNQVMLIGTHERTAYFEKHCFNLPHSDCERAWIFERVLGHQLIGEDNKIIEGVPSRIRCQEHCMNEQEFKCRSGEYDYETHQCRLSAIDRHTQPKLFRQAPGLNVDYFENQCVNLGTQCDAFDKYDNMDLGRAEILRSANSSEQCQVLCTQVIKAFICRSFTWSAETKKCYLNSANTFTTGGFDRLLPAPGLTYYQRNDCFDLQLECDHQAMTLQLRTNEPFRGRMYVRDDPMACETTGKSSMSSSLTIPFQSQARCAQRELVNRFSSVVVVQQHPLIQRRSDRYIKLVCDFQTANKTVISTYNVVANSWTSTALINATSFAPKIRLRITDRLNNDVQGAKLGDELFLNIEAETDSVYDMVARSVMAKSGGSESESILLIDKDGCPTDPRIFPSLNKVNRRTIRGKFDAFKFSTDVVVRFQVDVQFCLNQCPETRCEQGPLLGGAPFLLASQLSPNKGDFANGLDTYSSASSLASNSLGSSATTNGDMMSTVSMLQQHTPSPLEPYSARPLMHNTGHQQQSTGGLNATRAPSLFHPDHYTGAQFAGQEAKRQLMYPANQPPLAAGNFSNSQASDPIAASSSSSSLGDAQTFEARSSSASTYQDNSLGSGNPNVANNQQQSNVRRRRRSVEPMPVVPSHVPLQGEIIIRDRDEPPSSKGSQQANGNRQPATAAKKQSSRPRQRSSWRDAGPSYELNGSPDSSDQLEQTNEGLTKSVQDALTDGAQQQASLLCTNRHSLILAMLAFCAIQFLTIALCLVTWFHRHREGTTKLSFGSSSSSPKHQTTNQQHLSQNFHNQQQAHQHTLRNQQQQLDGEQQHFTHAKLRSPSIGQVSFGSHLNQRFC